MSRLCYRVASSVDGYIAGPNGEFDWIVGDPEIDFGAVWDRFDTLLMGRRTYEVARGGGPGFGDKEVVVVVTVIGDELERGMHALKQRPGKDIWLFGGGELLRSMIALDLVDTVEAAVNPVVLGAGVPLMAGPELRRSLTLTGHEVYGTSGIVLLEYAVRTGATSAGDPVVR